MKYNLSYSDIKKIVQRQICDKSAVQVVLLQHSPNQHGTISYGSISDIEDAWSEILRIQQS